MRFGVGVDGVVGRRSQTIGHGDGPDRRRRLVVEFEHAVHDGRQFRVGFLFKATPPALPVSTVRDAQWKWKWKSKRKWDPRLEDGNQRVVFWVDQFGNRAPSGALVYDQSIGKNAINDRDRLTENSDEVTSMNTVQECQQSSHF